MSLFLFGTAMNFLFGLETRLGTYTNRADQAEMP